MSRPRLSSILLVVNLVVLALPLGSIAVLRIYESALIRQTETELIAQGAFIAAAYRQALSQETDVPSGYGRQVDPEYLPDPEERWQPRAALLDLARSPIFPPPKGGIPGIEPDRVAVRIGSRMNTLIRDAQVVTLAGIRVLDYQGVVVASTQGEMGLSLDGRQEVSGALQGLPVSLLRDRILDQPPPPLASISRGTRLRVFVTTPIIVKDRLVAVAVLIRTPRNIVQALNARKGQLALAAAVLLGVVLLIATFTSYTISRPVRGLIAQTRRAIQGERGAVVPLERPVTREVEELSQTVATMAKTLEQRAEYIQTFASHVSHEFKTPLSAIQGAVELLQDHGETMPASDRHRFLSNVAGDTERLRALVSRLLELARADMRKAGHDDRASLDELGQRVAQGFTSRKLAVRVAENESGLVVRIAPETLESILVSLLDNAEQHGATSAQIEIVRKMRHEIPGEARRQMGWAREGVVIQVRDDGPGISGGHAQRIFEPFFTTARDHGGTGLGLAIARALLRAHQGEIELVDSKAGGTIMQISLPLNDDSPPPGNEPKS